MTPKKSIQAHWDQIYQNSDSPRLGWYEAYPEPSLQLIQESRLPKDAIILNVGAGSTTLVDELLAAGFQNVIANDISPYALEKLKQRPGKEAQQVRWVIDDLTRPIILPTIGQVDLWHDRAVLHFFNEKAQQDTYFDLLKKLVKSGGLVILAAFNLNGAAACSGLPVHRYDQNMLAEKLGAGFKLIKAFEYIYTMPSGNKRPYIYTLFERE